MRRLSAFLISIVATSFATGAEVGVIRGMLVDENSQRIMPGRAAVFLCDAESGLPLMSATKRPLDLTKQEADLTDLWHAVTNDNGSFEFPDVPVDKYRLFALSWAGISGMPQLFPGSNKIPLPEPSDFIILHGAAEGVEVQAGKATDALIKQFGHGVQRVLCDPEEEHNFILLSLHPTLGDPILGPAGWDPHFLTGVVGLTRMEVPHLTIAGLPAEQEFHIALLNYDNNAGVGGTSFVTGKQQTLQLPIYASWSNGKYDPPARLEKLTTHLEQSGVKLAELLTIEHNNFKAYADYVWQHGHDKIDIPGFGPATIADIIAADSYRSLRKSHAARLERLQQQQPAAK